MSIIYMYTHAEAHLCSMFDTLCVYKNFLDRQHAFRVHYSDTTT